MKKNKNLMTSVIGPRRAGKTYFMYDLIRKNVIGDEDSIFINFEAPVGINVATANLVMATIASGFDGASEDACDKVLLEAVIENDRRYRVYETNCHEQVPGGFVGDQESPHHKRHCKV